MTTSRTLTAARLRDDLGRFPSVVVGSPPCQDISSANTKGRGVEGERSGLYFEAVRIIGECRPRWFALENSANLRTRGADAVIAALEAIGYTCWPFVVRAGDIGANHERGRSWLLGCDIEQVTDTDGIGRHEGWCGRGCGIDVSVSGDYRRGCEAEHSESIGHEGGRPRGHGSHGNRAPSDTASDAGDATQDGCRPGISGRAYAAGDAHGTGNPSDTDQARQAHGCMESGVRQAEIADDGCCVGRSADGSGAGQMALCPSDCGDADRSGPDWSLAHLADHLRLDDGLSARLAGTRVDVGDGKGQSAASLVVEAFGDAVVPQIPEAIGRAILRTEAALAAVYGHAA
jgi:DNA (cytosine-5)-methyltransferase 1